MKNIFVLLVAYFSLQLTHAQTADPFEAELEACRVFFKLDDFEAMLTHANRAKQIKEDFHSYYYAALAYYKRNKDGDIERAKTELDSALAIVPAERLKEVQTLKDKISRTGEITEHLSKADEARKAGLTAKQAQELELAWKLHPEKTEIALEAAKLWIGLSEIVRGVHLLYLIKDQAKNDEVEVDADLLLNSSEEKILLALKELRKRHDTLVTNQDYKNLDHVNEQVCWLRPHVKEAFLLRAHAALMWNDELAIEVLKEGRRRANLNVDDIISLSRYGKLWEQKEFYQWLLDTYGPSVDDKISIANEKINKEAEEEVAAQKAEKERQDSARLQKIKEIEDRIKYLEKDIIETEHNRDIHERDWQEKLQKVKQIESDASSRESIDLARSDAAQAYQQYKSDVTGLRQGNAELKRLRVELEKAKQ
jgi:hypothetical protein